MGDYFDRRMMMMMIEGKYLSGDESFKIIKHSLHKSTAAGKGGISTRAYHSCFTVVNEFNCREAQIRGSLTSTGGVCPLNGIDSLGRIIG
jgi:hypothetical protein